MLSGPTASRSVRAIARSRVAIGSEAGLGDEAPAALHRREAALAVVAELVRERVEVERVEDDGRAGAHAVVQLAAQQAMDRLPGELAGDVPEGDVERRDREGDDAAVAAPPRVVA